MTRERASRGAWDRRAVAGAAALLALCLLARGVPAASPDDEKNARAFFKNGLSLYGKGKYEEALVSFEESYAIHPHWKIKYNIAMCYFALGSHMNAARLLVEFLDEGGGAIPKAQGKEALHALAKAKQKVGIVFFAGTLAGATVTIDGKVREGLTVGEEVFLGPGNHHVKVEGESVVPVDVDLMLYEGSVREIKVEPKPAPPVAAAAAAGPTLAQAAAAGAWKPPVVKKAAAPAKDAGAAVKPEAAPPGKKEKKKAAPLARAAGATLAFGLAMLAAGAGTGIAVLQEKEGMEDDELAYIEGYTGGSLSAGQLAALEESRDGHYRKAGDLAWATDALLAAGGALTFTAIVLFAVSAKRAKAVEKKPALSAGAGPASLSLVLSF